MRDATNLSLTTPVLVGAVPTLSAVRTHVRGSSLPVTGPAAAHLVTLTPLTLRYLMLFGVTVVPVPVSRIT